LGGAALFEKLSRLIKMSKTRHAKKGYKFGIRIPNTIEEAIAFEIENGNTLCQDAIKKEAGGVQIAFETQGNGKPPPGFKHVQLMMIFDIKMDFTRKARLVTRGDLTETPPALTYLSVVTRESVRIAFVIAALNWLDLMMFNVGNA
jgi:hypothetical protein